MWITLLVIAVAVSLEPFRLGMTVLMLNRPRPMLQLIVFLCGGYAMGMSVGLIVFVRLSAQAAGVRVFHLAQGTNSDWRAGFAGRCRTGCAGRSRCRPGEAADTGALLAGVGFVLLAVGLAGL